MVKNQKLLEEIKNILTNNLSLNIDRVILFGSRIDKSFKSYSDYDILIILNQSYDWKIEDNIIKCCYDLMLKYDIILDIKVISSSELNTVRGKQPYIQSAINLGITV